MFQVKELWNFCGLASGHAWQKERQRERVGVGEIEWKWKRAWAVCGQRLGRHLGRDLGRSSDSDCDGDSGLNCFAVWKLFHYQFLIYLR